MHRGLVFNIQKYSTQDGPGIRTTVFLDGCPLRCWWCHHPEEETRTMTVDEVLAEVLQDRTFYEESGGGVTFSGGEPLAQPDFLRELLRACRACGIHTAVDTCGHAPWEHLAAAAPFTDLFIYDLHVIDEKRHIEFTGVSNKLILSNLKALGRIHANIWVRVPVVPGFNDDAAELKAIARFAASVAGVKQVNLLPYVETGGRGQVGRACSPFP